MTSDETLAAGWVVEQYLLYDEEGVEGPQGQECYSPEGEVRLAVDPAFWAERANAHDERVGKPKEENENACDGSSERQ